MDVITAILTRRSAKHYRPDPVDRQLIEKMLAAAVRAPNHWLTEPWHFYVVSGEARKEVARIREEQMRAANRHPEDKIQRNIREINTIPYLIFVTCREGANEVETRENYGATYCAVNNMLLAAHAQGLAAIWRTGNFINYPPLRRFLGVSDDEDVIASVYVGYPEVYKESERTSWQQKTTWIGESPQ